MVVNISLARGAALWLLAAVISAGAVAQGSASPPAPASQDGQAAWKRVTGWPAIDGGVWGPERAPSTAGGPFVPRDGPQPKFRPEVFAAYKASDFAKLHEAGAKGCVPRGLPVDFGGEFVFSRRDIWLMSDLDYFVARRIHMDATEHGDPDPTYYGHSIGRWDGQTLVVDTVGFLPEVPIMDGIVEGQGATHVVERYKVLGPDLMEVTTTVENPKVLLEPWTIVRRMKRMADWTAAESYCEQNSRNDAKDGQASIDLTPPK